MPTYAELTLRFLEQQYPVREEVVDRVVRAGETGAIRVLFALMGTPGASIPEFARRMRERQTEICRSVIHRVSVARQNPGPAPIAFALVGTESPNAVAIHDANDDSFAIALDPGPVNLFNGVFLAALYALRSGDLPVLAWTLRDFVHSIFLNRIVPGFEECQLRLFKRMGSYQSAFGNVGDTMLRFIVAHEMAHIELGHFRQENTPRMKLLPDAKGEEEISAFDHDREFAADAWAVEHLKSSLPPTATVIEAAGLRLLPPVFFAIAGLAQELHPPQTPIGRKLSDSHPSPWERGRRLRAAQGMPAAMLALPAFGILHQLPDFLDSHRVALIELAHNHPADRLEQS